MNSPEGSNFEGCGFKVGDTVVCVELDQFELKRNNLSHGQRYVVKGVVEDFTSPEDSILRLEGREGWGQGVFAYRFKKVETQKEITMEQTAERIREDILHIEKRIDEAKKDITSMEEEKNVLVQKLKEKGFVLAERVEVKPVESFGEPSTDNVAIGTKLRLLEDSLNNRLRSGDVVIVNSIDPYNGSPLPWKVSNTEGIEDWVFDDKVVFA